MRLKTFTVTTLLPPDEVLSRLVQLFEAGGVMADRADRTVRSVDIPLPLLSIDPHLYSRRNGVGINPFILASKVEAMAVRAEGGGTLLIVQIDRMRLLAVLAIAVAIALGIVIFAPLPGLAAAAIVSGLCLLQLRWSHTLLRREMENALSPGGSS
ncbi:MAG TPA: hypothetical protein VJS12_22965 [Steroidobacteraceae bacterium]|nr:hypothetical protein [Steroidobacteraceae bacterium]